jgi:hypothetical protein
MTTHSSVSITSRFTAKTLAESKRYLIKKKRPLQVFFYFLFRGSVKQWGPPLPLDNSDA